MNQRPILQVRDLKVSFRMPRTGPHRRNHLRAVDGVDLDLDVAETVGVVGESGSGKSTLGRAILGLTEIEDGSIEFDGLPLRRLRSRELRRARGQMSMVFQDPYSSLNPSLDIASSVGEPLEVHERLDRRQRDQRVAELLEVVGLRADHMRRYPHEFSGGQRQRIAIARAIALNPRLVICDEPVSSLDVSTQNQIINLLQDLSATYRMAMLFIAHDLAVVRHLASRVAVMYLGQIVESGPTERIFESPAHPYTLSLLSAVPLANPREERRRQRIVLHGDLPDPVHPPTGCRFHTRCPWAMDVCAREAPPKVSAVGGGIAACHQHTSGHELAGRSVNILPIGERDAPPSSTPMADGRLPSTIPGSN